MVKQLISRHGRLYIADFDDEDELLSLHACYHHGHRVDLNGIMVDVETWSLPVEIVKYLKEENDGSENGQKTI